MTDPYTTNFHNTVGVVNVGQPPILRPDDPDLIDCPHGCGQRTWWNRELCWNCGRPVLAVIQRQEWQKDTQVKMKMGSCLIALAPVVYYGEQYFFDISFIPGLAVGLVGVVFFLSFLSRNR